MDVSRVPPTTTCNNAIRRAPRVGSYHRSGATVVWCYLPALWDCVISILTPSFPVDCSIDQGFVRMAVLHDNVAPSAFSRLPWLDSVKASHTQDSPLRWRCTSRELVEVSPGNSYDLTLTVVVSRVEKADSGLLGLDLEIVAFQDGRAHCGALVCVRHAERAICKAFVIQRHLPVFAPYNV